MEQNLVLYVGSYDDADTAQTDFQALKDAQSGGAFDTVGAVVISRAADGKIDVKEHGSTAVGAGATVGGITGLIVGLFAPPLLLMTAVGAGLGAGLGELSKRREEKELGVDFEEYLPPGSSAVVVVADMVYADQVNKALGAATKQFSKPIDDSDYTTLHKVLSDAGYTGLKAM
jgi:uncharacterized membrane protein